VGALQLHQRGVRGAPALAPTSSNWAALVAHQQRLPDRWPTECLCVLGLCTLASPLAALMSATKQEVDAAFAAVWMARVQQLVLHVCLAGAFKLCRDR
jgi:hypothetical protein